MTLSMLSSSKVAAGATLAFSPSEGMISETTEGVYLGRTLVYDLPFFLDTQELLNPHITAIGMTGSGKTYFMKSYIAKFRLYSYGDILILDWNGEYNELVSFLDGRIIDVDGENLPEFEIINCGVLSINLSKQKDDNKRRLLAQAVVNKTIMTMHNMEIGSRKKRIFLLDEAWRTLGKQNNLGQLFREGRKYGFSIVISTQLASDINNEILANSGAVFIFHLQNASDQCTLIDSGIVPEQRREVLSNLSIGNCIVRLAQKETNRSSNIVVRKIDGVPTSLYCLNGDKMQVKITSARFKQIADEVISNEDAKIKLVGFIEANEKSLDLNGLVRLLHVSGIKRAEVVTFLRLVGFNDITIVKACESIKDVMVKV